jgi:hypothetical protein
MGVDSTTISGLLKRIYSTDTIENMQNMVAETFPKIKKSPKKPAGEGFFFAVNVQGNQRGQGSQTELEPLRTPSSQTPVQGRVVPKIFTHTIRYSGLSLELAKGNEESFADNVTFQVEEGIKDATKELNAQCFRSGLGRIAKVDGAVSNSKIIAFKEGVPTHFRVGMYIDVINDSGTKQIDGVKVVDVDVANNTIELESAQSCDDGAWIYREKTGDNAPPDGKELTGFVMMVDDGSQAEVYENISRATYPTWRGITVDAGGSSISNDLLQRVVAKMKVLGGRKPNKIISNTSQFRKYLNVVTPLKRFFDKDKLDSGYVEVPTWNGIEWVEDTDCPFEAVIMYDSEYVEKFELYPLKLDDSTGSTLKWDSGYDGFVSYLKYYGNLGTRNPRAIAAMYNLAVPTF